MLYIDASRYSNTPNRTGVENYSYFLIKELVQIASKEITLISPRKIDLEVKQLVIPFPRLWTQLRLSWEIWRNKKIKNLFVPSHLMPLIHPKNTIITIHDVVFRRFPESYGRLSRWYLHWGAKFAVKYAKKIIVPSVATKQDLIGFYKCPEEKIQVIPLGFEKVPTPYQREPEDYLLYIGRIEHKKNIDTLIKAFKIFAKSNTKTKLLLVGFLGRGGEPILESIPENLQERIEVLGYVTENQKEELLSKAKAFIFPSRYEGFGLPLLEAMAHDLPIITSNIPSSKEILGNSGLYFEVEDAKELARQMEFAAKENLEEKTQNYPTILQKYSWRKTAQQTLELLKK